MAKKQYEYERTILFLLLFNLIARTAGKDIIIHSPWLLDIIFLMMMMLVS